MVINLYVATSKQIVVRIQGGRWKRSSIHSLALDDVRPTLGRMRQTLANWVRPYQPLRVLDLFAGTGALGFEMASQGAAKVTMIEHNRQLATMLTASVSKLRDSSQIIEIHCSDAYTWLATNSQTYDLLLLDPPFQHNFSQGIRNITASTAIHKNTLVYYECNKKNIFQLPDVWQIIKQKKMGNVIGSLYKYE